MHVPVWVWLATVAGIAALFIFDFYAHVRKPHDPSFKEAAWWSVFFIALAMVFGGGLWWVWGAQHGAEYFAGFITEKSLSVDNLFVFLIIMAKFAVPRAYQQKALLIGIVIALILRGIFIAVGAAVRLDDRLELGVEPPPAGVSVLVERELDLECLGWHREQGSASYGAYRCAPAEAPGAPGGAPGAPGGAPGAPAGCEGARSSWRRRGSPSPRPSPLLTGTAAGTALDLYHVLSVLKNRR
mgnify:CR=1 FL=1